MFNLANGSCTKRAGRSQAVLTEIGDEDENEHQVEEDISSPKGTSSSEDTSSPQMTSLCTAEHKRTKKTALGYDARYRRNIPANQEAFKRCYHTPIPFYIMKPQPEYTLAYILDRFGDETWEILALEILRRCTTEVKRSHCKLPTH
jgi:hypothetical protein